MADPIPPGQRWLKTMEKFYLLHPSIVNRQGDLKYWTASATLILSNLLVGLRFAIGAFWPEIGLSLSNFFNVLGHGGQLVSAAVAPFIYLILYCQIQMLREKDASFVMDIVAYDDSKNRTVL